jgi:GNAT superfamily N-acetyltransferase
MKIVPASADDAAAVSALSSVVFPDRLLTEAHQRRRIAQAQGEARFWKAEDADGSLAGWSWAGREWHSPDPERGMGGVLVRPEARGQGLGSALWERAEGHLAELGARVVTASSLDDAESRPWIERRGFHVTGTGMSAAVDPRTVAAPEEIPTGAEVVPLSRFAADPRPVFELDMAGSEDEPGDSDWSGLTLESWTRTFWLHPDHDPEISAGVLVDGRLASMSIVFVDAPTRRAANGLTATYREHRGRGLATLAKRHALAQAAARGITRVMTEMDETNAAMQAVNRRLGYEPFAVRLSWRRESS